MPLRPLFAVPFAHAAMPHSFRQMKGTVVVLVAEELVVLLVVAVVMVVTVVRVTEVSVTVVPVVVDTVVVVDGMSASVHSA